MSFFYRLSISCLMNSVLTSCTMMFTPKKAVGFSASFLFSISEFLISYVRRIDEKKQKENYETKWLGSFISLGITCLAQISSENLELHPAFLIALSQLIAGAASGLKDFLNEWKLDSRSSPIPSL